MSRPATTTEILLAIRKLQRLIKPKGAAAEIPIEDYEAVLQGVSAEALATATLNLMRSSKFVPLPSQIFAEINRIDYEGEVRVAERQLRSKERSDPDNDVLTPGQRRGFPLLQDDPEGRARCQALWDRVRPTLGGKSFDDAAKDMAALRRQHPVPNQLSDEERLQLLRDKAEEPIQVTDALLKSLSEPMRKG